jgi:hypothetical protein
MSLQDALVDRAQEYTRRQGLTLGDRLGSGVHGTVFVAESLPEKGHGSAQCAIKVHQRQADYCRERDVYLRLKENGIFTIRGCHVPELLRYDDELWIIDMTVVSKPFVLDFAGAFLDKSPDFSDEVLSDWLAEKQEQFGPDWPEVQRILAVLQDYGIFLVDVSPSNICVEVHPSANAHS